MVFWKFFAGNSACIWSLLWILCLCAGHHHLSSLYFGMFDIAKCLMPLDGQKMNFYTAWAFSQVRRYVGSGIAPLSWYNVPRRMMMQSGRKYVPTKILRIEL
uniref:Secreted protein n=1 Tax=Ditylenchus dipsaci TaxID=166011 RepID=A0A915E0I7_9BILA